MSSKAAAATYPFTIGLEFMNKETDGSGQQFGCLKFATTAFPEGYKQKGKYRVHVSLDVSTSMNNEGRLRLAEETIVKMVEYLASAANENPGLQFWITLTTFSNEARVIVGNKRFEEGMKAPIINRVPIASHPFGADMVYYYSRR